MGSKLKGTLTKVHSDTTDHPVNDKKNTFAFKSTVPVSSAPVDSFETHIAFAQELIEKYDWDPKIKTALENKLDSIKKKHEDKCLNLCVVGEFSTGKSTFINAMLRKDDFLVSSSLQGTTVSGTIIEDSESYSITLDYNDGHTDSFVYESADELKENLVTFTTDPQVAQKLSTVRIGVPSTPLKKGFRIIDTPGTNANEVWHEEVTLHTVQEYADMLILIMDGTKPFAESFRDFVKGNLSLSLNQAIFVVTRYDMLRRRERKGVMDYLSMKVADEFELEAPLVLPYAAIDVLDSCVEGTEPSDLAILSEESEKTMLEYMAKKKSEAQKRKLSDFMSEMYANLYSHMLDISKGYKDELDMLLRTRAVDLNSFVVKEKSDRISSFESTVSEQGGLILAYIDNCAFDACSAVFNKIETLADSASVKDFVANELSGLCYNEAKKAVVGAKKRSMSIYHWFEEEIIRFHADFDGLFDNLEILRVSFGNTRINLPDAATITLQNMDELSHFLNKIKTRTDVAKTKAKVRELLYDYLFSYFSQVSDQIRESYYQNISNTKECILSEIDKYLVAYDDIVTSRIEQEKIKIRDVEYKISQLKSDMTTVDKYKNYLCEKK